MKKQSLLLTAIVLLCCNAFSQGYLSTSIVNKGIAANIGFLSGKTDINFGVQFPITEITVPAIYHIEVGRRLNITNNEEGNNYSITPSVGAASLHKQQLVKTGIYRQEYNRSFNYDTYEKVNYIKPYFSFEFGKDAYIGRVFIKTVYCENIYYSVGMRLFFNRKNIM